MKSKEEILEENLGADLSGLGVNGVFNLFSSMDEYAKEHSIAFAKWATENYWWDDDNELWNSYDEGADPFRFDEEELYKKFLQETNNPRSPVK